MTRSQTRSLTADTAQRTAVTGALTAGVLALGLMVANPVSAQNYRYDRYPDRDRSSSGEDVLLGAAVGAVAGAIIGNGEGEYILGGAVAGAAIGATANRGDDCNYYRGGRCYRNQGHWEREHGINSRDPRYYGNDRRDQRYDRRYDRRDDRRDRRYDRRDDRRDYRDDRRDYRYDRRW
ncbi:MAG: hypothetical protein Q8R97_08935 [Brevundimonas sp.]|uniref:hypothetical protein n=1 Tax=Brevundimonas sp. TaxID=1871086 RepID=UPI0027628B1C|nr:hypothetical protein [Brevundimonas sp.]MDP3401230.1 hypothetical protein [Brevundimonas sp.]MDZ4110925.1 hypothetical protein [Brevundimonas sp.]